MEVEGCTVAHSWLKIYNCFGHFSSHTYAHSHVIIVNRVCVYIAIVTRLVSDERCVYICN